MQQNLLKFSFYLPVLFSLFSLPLKAEQDYSLADALRFEKLWQLPTAIQVEDVKSLYIAPGSEGISIFTPGRIRDENHLVNVMRKHAPAYEKALKICLPAAKNIEQQSNDILTQVQGMLNQKQSAPVYIVFGANNSGGTANEKGLVIGLEVVCRFAENEQQAEQTLLGFVAHEVVHVYQARIAIAKNKKRNHINLLEQSLREGFADFVANLALGTVTRSEQERHDYGMKHEAQLWQEFQQAIIESDKNPTRDSLAPWMYIKPKDGRPADLGYWIGKRIAQAYYQQANDKQQALQTLLHLDDAKTILKKSGYAKSFSY